MLKAYKYRLYPNKTQEELLNKTFGCCRYFWNKQVEAFNSYDKDLNPKPIFKTVKELREESDWMKEVSHQAVKQKEIDFFNSKNNYFNPEHRGKSGRPKFKNKTGHQSFRLVETSRFKPLKDKIRIEKIGWVKYVQHNPLPDNCEIRNATFSKDTLGHYYVSILVETKVKHFEKTGKSVGIDVGLKEFATLSDGVTIHSPHYFRESQAELRQAQKHLSRKKKGSTRYKKQKIKVAKIHKKIARQRELFLHTTSLNIVKNYDVISIEDLNVEGMKKNRRLSKSISDASWSKFFSYVKYKSEWYGKEVLQVDRFAPTSKTCSNCNNIKKGLKLSERTYHCDVCGHEMGRDLNAANNIKALGVTSAQRA